MELTDRALGMVVDLMVKRGHLVEHPDGSYTVGKEPPPDSKFRLVYNVLGPGHGGRVVQALGGGVSR